MDALSKKQRIILEEAHSRERNKRQADRIKTILALDKGFSHRDVAAILMLNDSTTRRYEQDYENGGLDELLCDRFTGGTSKLSEEQEGQLDIHLTEKTYTTAKAICRYVQAAFSVTYTEQGIVPLLHRLQFSYKKLKHVPGKADPKKQRLFIKLYRRLRKKTKNSNIVLYFLDGSHPQHNSMPSYGWIKQGTDKELKSNTGRQRVNLNGALNIEDHTVVVRQEDTIDAGAVVRLCKDLEAKHPDADTIYVIADNARYNRAKIVREYEATSRIKFIYLPPYAPNLNLIERLWKFFHKKVMYGQYHASYLDFREAITAFFERINDHQYTDELSSLLAENFQIIGEQVSQS